MPKYIFVTGGVLSSVGKGIVTASIGKILQVRGFRVTAIKIDPYLNVDAGTMNPYMHGEIFVTEDGGETDLDLGHYERFLDINLSKINNITTGQIYQSVIQKERRGDYLGKCVQIIPHITDEIKARIRRVAEEFKAEITLVEVGGTVGDIEGLPFLEAIRQMRLDEGKENTLFVHVALVPILKVTGEQKTKPLQHSINELRRIGIQPDIVVARCETPLRREARTKIALFSNVPIEDVFTSYTVDDIYKVPLILEEQGLGERILNKLKLPERSPSWEYWKNYIMKRDSARRRINIAMCGKYVKLKDAYLSIREALKHAATEFYAKVNFVWIDVEEVEKNLKIINKVRLCDGIVLLPGFGERGVEGKIVCAKVAREENIPFLGICFGMQLAVVEFARNVVGLKGAHTTEVDKHTPYPVIDMLPEQRLVNSIGGSMRLGSLPIRLRRGTLAYKLYRREIVYERHRHRYEVNPKFWRVLQKYGLVFSGMDPDQSRVEIIEYPRNTFYLGIQAHPEYKSRPGKPHPLFIGFIKATLKAKIINQ